MQKKTLFHWGLMALVIFSLLGCTKTVEVHTIFTPTSMPLATATVQGSSPSPTKTDIPTTPNPGSSSNEVNYQCISINNDVKQLGSLNGTLVLNGYFILLGRAREISNPTLLVNVRDGTEIPLSVKETDNHFEVSPGGDYLAYDVWRDNTNQWQIHILDANGNSSKTVDVEDLQSFEWLDKENLLVNSLSAKLEHNPLIFLSPFENKEKLIQPFVTASERIMPSADSELLYQWGFYSYHKIIYNPTLTRAVYAAADEDGPKIVFRDLQSNQDISVFHIPAWGQSPKWSPDGTKLAVGMNTSYSNVADLPNKYELAIFDNNGQQLFLTELSTLPTPVYISSLAWSPDGSKIAFWYTTNKDINRDLRLAIFDLSTQQVIDYCITKDSPYYRWHTNDKSPIWSPDGNYLLVETANEDIPNAVIVDLVHENAVIIKNSYEPVGWMQ